MECDTKQQSLYSKKKKEKKERCLMLRYVSHTVYKLQSHFTPAFPTLKAFMSHATCTLFSAICFHTLKHPLLYFVQTMYFLKFAYYLQIVRSEVMPPYEEKHQH